MKPRQSEWIFPKPRYPYRCVWCARQFTDLKRFVLHRSNGCDQRPVDDRAC
jgi:hypothetical protein